MPPDFLAIGHVVKDITGGGWRIGGSVAYATLQATRLGLSAAGLTACGSEIDPPTDMPWAEWKVISSPATTTFENVYKAGRREQHVIAAAATVPIEDVPDSWRQAPIVLLGPVIREIEPGDTARLLRSSLIGVNAQGWLRRLQGTRVLPGIFKPRPSWLHGTAVFLSEEDLIAPESAAQWDRQIPIVVLTKGSRGCTMWTKQSSFDVAAPPVPEVDPTGAGDVFAAAFLVRLRETDDALESARFASAAASLVVQGAGLEAIGDRKAIDGVLASSRTASS